MISKLSLLLAKRLCSDGKILEDEIDLYSYGLFVLISQLFMLFVTAVLGLVFSCVLESVLFYAAFQSIRKFAGGYHASTEARCEIMSSLSILICVILIRLSRAYDYQAALLIITAIAAACIFIMCPLDTPEKPLTEEEFRQFRRISRIILLIITVVIIFSVVFKISLLLYPACLSLILESILLIAGKIKVVILKKGSYNRA